MKKVLVVDDAITVRLYHRKMMEELKLAVDEAENGIEALEKGLQDDYDLFLVDVNMPKMDGYRLVEEMRGNEKLRDTPVIMVSTEAEGSDRDKAFKAGANFYLVKPAKMAELKTYASLLVGG